MSLSLSLPRRILALAGVVCIVATWLYLVLVRPADWESVGGSASAIITLAGYVGGAVLLLAATLPAVPVRTISLIPVALVLNIVVGEIVGSVGIPLYLDSLGTVLVAALAGPLVGLATGTLSSVVWGLINPAALPFAAASALVGGLAGWLLNNKKVVRTWWATALSGALVGIICGMIAAPVAAFVYGGTAGVGTGALVSAFRAMGNSLLGSVTLQSFISDPLDKILVFLLVRQAVMALPKRTVAQLRGEGA
ncbi:MULTISPECIES: ECF transporter S component [unclassified Corynebacterium]|uniref:ECF transporter S component n=1 Tax=unclassified Corynebacterium TaxID=2624378 RepID=UPI0029C9DA38|nr:MULTISPECIES: ECF transporter S component [unclassified Corynebacterium]WPF66982.1 ECF transporter S component [Corynebacterium sp. 22KM0430]WPF69470.1 ECF transporter S component [Corynebacterium sp. 21KM1197]